MPSRSCKSRKVSVSRSITNNKVAKSDQPRSPKPEISSSLPTNLPSSTSLPHATPPPNWDTSLPYLSHPIFSPYLPPTHLKWLRHRPQDLDLPTITLPLSQSDVQSRVEIRLIDDPEHPACGQRGLFAARDLTPGELIVVYLGYVHGSTDVERGEYERLRGIREGGNDNHHGDHDEVSKSLCEKSFHAMDGHALLSLDSRQHNGSVATDLNDLHTIGSWDTSSYDLNMYREADIEVAVDAANMGNEARYVNDYRGIPVSLSQSLSTQADEPNNTRKEKRKVKAKVEAADGRHTNDATAETTTRGGDWQTSWQYKNGGNIAMPNAEFRDVWFNIQQDVDLSLELFRAERLASVRSQVQSSGSDDQCTDVIPTDEVSFVSTLDGLQISEPVREHQTRDIDCDARPPRRKRKSGIRGVAIFVMPAGRSGKRKHGIKKGQEVLVSYGKGFWAHHGLDP